MVAGISSAFFVFVLVLLLLLALPRRQRLYHLFVEGAAGGFNRAVAFIPPLVGFLVALRVWRAAGLFEQMGLVLEKAGFALMPPDFWPLILLRPFQPETALAAGVELFHRYGPDSFYGRWASLLLATAGGSFALLRSFAGEIEDRRYLFFLFAFMEGANAVFSWWAAGNLF